MALDCRAERTVRDCLPRKLWRIRTAVYETFFSGNVPAKAANRWIRLDQNVSFEYPGSGAASPAADSDIGKSSFVSAFPGASRRPT